MDIDNTEEVQVLPGVYITDYRTTGDSSSSHTPQHYPSTLPLSCDSDPNVTLEVTELENSIKHLIRSNVELAKAMEDDPDPVYAESIQENMEVIAKRKLKIKELLSKQGRRR